MERHEIIKRFKENGFNDQTINLLLDVISDFQITGFTKYVTIEEVVNRICQNLKSNIEFESIKKSCLGIYNSEEEKIILSETIKENQNQISSVVFHEIMHCITNFKNISSVRISSNM